jgi:hypothetical protein
MCYASAPANSRSSGLAARHAPIDRFIARRKVALLISGAFPHLVARHAGPNPSDFLTPAVLTGHPLRPGKPSQLDDAFRLKMIDGIDTLA